MAEQRARAKPAEPHIDGPVNAGAHDGMTSAVETMQAFAREIAQMSEQALVRTNRHTERLRKAHRIEEAEAIQADFLKEAMDHAVQHTRKYIEMLAVFPPKLLWPVNAAVEMAHAARHATAASIERLSEATRKA